MGLNFFHSIYRVIQKRITLYLKIPNADAITNFIFNRRDIPLVLHTNWFHEVAASNPKVAKDSLISGHNAEGLLYLGVMVFICENLDYPAQVPKYGSLGTYWF